MILVVLITKKDEFLLVFFRFSKMCRQCLEFCAALLEVLVLVVTRCGWRQQTDIARLGMGSKIGKGFFHVGVIVYDRPFALRQAQGTIRATGVAGR